MSRCLSCNEILSKEEYSRKSEVTGDHLDLCNACLYPIAEDIHDSLPAEDPLWDAVVNE